MDTKVIFYVKKNRKKRAEKIKELSDVIKDMNSDKVANQKPIIKEVSKTITKRERALEFAKNIPKPKQMQNEGESEDGDDHFGGGKKRLDKDIRVIEGDLEQLEKQHQYFQNKISNINN